MAIPLRPTLPAFIQDAAAPAAAAPAAAPAPGAAGAAASSGGFRLNKPRQFSAADLEASYAQQTARKKGWPSWLNRILNPSPQPGAPGAGLLPTLPPGQQFPIMYGLMSVPPPPL